MTEDTPRRPPRKRTRKSPARKPAEVPRDPHEMPPEPVEGQTLRYLYYDWKNRRSGFLIVRAAQ